MSCGLVDFVLVGMVLKECGISIVGRAGCFLGCLGCDCIDSGSSHSMLPDG